MFFDFLIVKPDAYFLSRRPHLLLNFFKCSILVLHDYTAFVRPTPPAAYCIDSTVLSSPLA